MQRLTGAVISVLMMSLALTADAAGSAENGKAKSGLCAACHGHDGNSTNGLWPKLAGQHAMYLTKALKDFRAGTRKDPIMSALAKPLSDAEIADLATYFAGQKQK